MHPIRIPLMLVIAVVLIAGESHGDEHTIPDSWTLSVGPRIRHPDIPNSLRTENTYGGYIDLTREYTTETSGKRRYHVSLWGVFTGYEANPSVNFVHATGSYLWQFRPQITSWLGASLGVGPGAQAIVGKERYRAHLGYSTGPSGFHWGAVAHGRLRLLLDFVEVELEAEPWGAFLYFFPIPSLMLQSSLRFMLTDKLALGISAQHYLLGVLVRNPPLRHSSAHLSIRWGIGN